MIEFLKAGVLSGIIAGVAAAGAQAQEAEILSTQGAGSNLFASIFGAPSAMTPPKQTLFFAVSGANPRGGIKGAGWDYDTSIGYGFGNPISSVGGMISVDVTGTNPYADTGSFSLAFSRAIAVTENTATFIGVSGSGLAGWAPKGVKEADPKAAIMVSQYATLGANGYPVTWTVGYGQDAKYQGTVGKREDGVFWGVGVGATSFMSLSLSGTENQVNAGATVVVPGVNGLSLSLGRYDLGNKSKRQQDAFSISYSMKLGAK